MVTAAVLALVAGVRGRRAAVRGLTALGLTSLLVNAGLKPLFRRERPSLRAVPAIRHLRRPPLSTSFPSGHAASAWAFTTGVGLELPAAAGPVGALAGAVSYSRVYSGVHYPVDVLAGAGVGIAVALLARARQARPGQLPEEAADLLVSSGGERDI
jgi:membrane-associated phospholipid phosphatase